MRKPVFGVSDQVRHKPVCTTIEDGYRLKISDLGCRGIVLSMVWLPFKLFLIYSVTVTVTKLAQDLSKMKDIR